MERKNTPPIGTGAFSHIFKDTWGNMPDALKILSHHQDTMSIAIKKSRGNARDEQYLEHEIAIHRRLNHPNIVAFMGVLGESPARGLVMELLLDGDLSNILMPHQDPIPLMLQFSIARDIARGLNYLHSMEILHRDLKTKNILIEKRGESVIAKICDFGLSVSFNSINYGTLVGTPRFMAPELMTRRPPCLYSTKSDVFAFALILWSLRTQLEPFQRATTLDSLRRLIKRGERDTIPDNTPTDFATLITDCWTHHPQNRPSSIDIIHRLTVMLTSLCLTEQPMTALSNLIPSQLDTIGKNNLKTKFYKAIKENNITECQLLLAQGVEPNCLFKGNHSALTLAAAYKHPEICDLLLEHGADPMIKNKQHKTAEDCWPKQTKHKNPFKRLRKKLHLLANNDPRLSDDQKESFLTLILVKNTNLLDWPLVLDSKLEPNFLFFALQYNQAKIMSRLTADKRWPVWSQMTTLSGYTLLHCISTFNHGTLFFNKLCVISINDADNIDGSSALHVAVKYKQIDMCQRLIRQGADLNVQDNLNLSALMIAAIHGDQPICRLLLENGADPKLKNNAGKTAEETWITRHQEKENPFIEHRKSQILRLIESTETNPYLVSLYARLALQDLRQRITQAYVDFTHDNHEQKEDEVLNKVINDWEATKYYCKPAKKMAFFQENNQLEEVLKSIRALIITAFSTSETLRDKPAKDIAPTSSFLPAIKSVQ